MLAKKILEKYWGYSKFRSLQQEIVESALQNQDTIALLPTGGGKSVCFQVPAIIKDGITIVVSPLIALMKDQVEQLKKRGIPAVAIHSGLSYREIDILLDNCVLGHVKLLYVSPERLKSELLIERAKRMQVAMLVVDEAHCISQWGYDFRPSYHEIPDFRKLFPSVPVMALTATATPEVRKDIEEKLELKDAKTFVSSFKRDNLSYSSFEEENKEAKLVDIMRKVPGSAIVYVKTRKRTKEIASLLYKAGISVDFYHAGLSNKERSQKQDAWVENRVRVIVSTNAFGMGIDKPDVRLVVHMDLPETLEAYFQEAGRAGRDGGKAYGVLLYNQTDLEELPLRVEEAYPQVDFIKKVYQCLANFYKIAVGSSNLSEYDFDLEELCKTYQLPSKETYNAIKKLELEGFIQLNEAFYLPSRIHFNIDHAEMYAYLIANSKQEPVIKTLLRIYGGELYTYYVSINEAYVARQMQVSVDEVLRQLDYLKKTNAAEYDKQKNKPQVVFTTMRYDASKLPFSIQLYEKLKKGAVQKAASVSSYAVNPVVCRSVLLVSYFGEEKAEECGVCDNCLKRKKKEQGDELKSIKAKILSILNSGPMQGADLVKLFSTLQKEILQTALKELLDDEEIYYGGDSKLYLKNID